MNLFESLTITDINGYVCLVVSAIFITLAYYSNRR